MLKLIATFVALTFMAIQASAAPLESQPIKIQLKWKHQFQFAGYYAAISQGFYREAGFEVELLEAGPGINPIDKVLKGEADYGIANSEIALYRMNGAPVIALAAILQHSPMVLLSLKDSNILSPQDLIGKRVMFPSGEYGANTRGLLLKEGVKESQVNSIPLSYNINDLVEGKVDAMAGYVTDQPYQLKMRNIAYNLIDPRAYGIDFYGDILFAHQNKASSASDELNAIIAATIKGWRYAVENPDQIIQIIIDQYNSERSYEELVNEARATIELIVPELVDLGHMNRGRWQHIADTFKALEMSEGQLLLDDFLYHPEYNRTTQLTRDLIQLLSIILIVGVSIISLLFHFNKRLKESVAEKTMYLTKANRELMVYTKQLREKEDELHRFNNELEQRIIARTETINKINHDLTEEIKQKKQKELSLQLLSQAIESSNAIVLVINKHLMIDYVSPAFLKLSGYGPKELEQQPVSVLSDKIMLPFSSEKQIQQQALNPNNKSAIEHEIKCLDAEGNAHWLSSKISLLWEEYSKSSPQISHYVIIFEDVTSHKEQRDKMEKMALYDNLTGLENRALFQKQLEKVILQAQRDHKKTALLFIDIDDFKDINDSLGHKAGDQVLKTIAERLREHVRQNDSIARISGDEFTILLSDINCYEDASRVTRNILSAFEEAVVVGHHEVFVTLSIGISITPEDSINMSELVHNADLAMYQAKESGKNTFRFFSEDMNREVEHKSLIESEIKRAIDEQSFYLVYQPKFKLNESTIIGAEALIRWQFNETDVRTPDDFIPIAESGGTIIPIGQWVLKQVFDDLLRLHKEGIKHINISVNISARQLKEKSFVSQIRSLFANHPQLLSSLELEITESCFLEKSPQYLAKLDELKQLGLSLSIDDFGTGYSSLSYLKRLPVSTIKLDKTLIDGLPDNQDSAQITSAVVAMAHELDICVTAEGVETKDQSDFLSQLDCDEVQGFLYERPMRIDELITRFAQTQRSISQNQ